MNRIILPKPVKMIIDILEKNGYEGFAVGGCVRDVMLGREPKDWDITTNAHPTEVKKLFNRTIDTGIKHGTVTVMINHVGYEVTTYRIDGDYEDGRHPNSVEFTSNLLEDLKRRDFTINAMAYNDSRGLVDAFGGLEDLKKGIIRCVGSPKERFTEDALRIMRAVRFAAQLGFVIEENTARAVRELADNLQQISMERIQAELHRLILSDNPHMIRDAYRLGITKVVLPEFDTMMETGQNSPYHCYNVGEHTIRVMEYVRNDRYLRWAALLHDVGKPQKHTVDVQGIDHFHGHEEVGGDMAKKILKRLRMDNKTIDTVSKLVKYHDYPLTPDGRSLRHSISVIGKDIYPLFLELRRGDLAGKNDYSKELNAKIFDEIDIIYEEICRTNCPVSIGELAVNGKDLIEAGVPKGKAIGDILDKLLEMVLDEPERNNREYLLEQVIQFLHTS